MFSIIGRTNLQKEILDLIESSTKHKDEKRIIFVQGQAGMGKTFLLENIKNIVSFTRKFAETPPIIAYTSCSTPLANQEIGNAEALKPWADLLQKIVTSNNEEINNLFKSKKFDFKKFLIESAPSWLKFIPIIGTYVGAVTDIGIKAYKQFNSSAYNEPTANQEQIFQQYLNFLSKISDYFPIVLIIDDFHWADNTSCNLLFAAARQLKHKPINFIISYRLEDANKSKQGKCHPLLEIKNELIRYDLSIEFEVDAFTKEDIEELLSRKYRKYIQNEAFVNWLVDISAGNILYIVQYLAKLEEERYIEKRSGKILKKFSDIEIPHNIIALIQSRLSNLSAKELEIIHFASVEGNVFTVEIISKIMGERISYILKKLRGIKRTGLIQSLGVQVVHKKLTTVYKFSHDQIHKAVYDSLDQEERNIIHKLVFKVLKDRSNSKVDINSLVNNEIKLAIHANAIKKHYFAAKTLMKVAYENWKVYATIETTNILKGVFTSLDLMKENEKNNKEIIELKIEALLIKGEICELNGMWEDGLKIYDSALYLSENINAKNLICILYLNKAKLLRKNEDFDNALKMLNLSISLSKKTESKECLAMAYGNIGNILFMQGNYNQALIYSRKYLRISTSIKNKTGISTALIDVANAYYSKGHFEKSLKTIRNSLLISKKIQNKWCIARAYGTMGHIYFDKGNHKKALFFYEEYLKSCQNIGDKLGVINAFFVLGNIYYQQDDFEKSLVYYNESLNISLSIGLINGIAQANMAIGTVYGTLGDYGKAITHHNICLSLIQKKGELQILAAVHFNIGCFQFFLRNYKASIFYFKKALNYNRKMDYTIGIQYCLLWTAWLLIEIHNEFKIIPGYCNSLFASKENISHSNILLKCEYMILEAINLSKNTHNEEQRLNGKILLNRIQYAKGNVNRAINGLKKISIKALNLDQKADTLYYLCKFSKLKYKQIKYGEEALKIYETLFAKSPTYRYKILAEEIRNIIK